jgi:hypothetical protein
VLIVSLAFLCCGAGCLDFEKQTMVLVFPKEGDEIRGLFVYHGLQVGGGIGRLGKNHLSQAKADLARLAGGKTFYVGSGLTRASGADARRRCCRYPAAHAARLASYTIPCPLPTRGTSPCHEKVASLVDP